MIWNLIQGMTTSPDDVVKLGKVLDAIQAATSSPAQVADTCRVVAYAAGTPGGFDKVRAALQVRSDSLVEDAPAPGAPPVAATPAPANNTGSSGSGSGGSSGAANTGSSGSGASGSSGPGTTGTGGTSGTPVGGAGAGSPGA